MSAATQAWFEPTPDEEAYPPGAAGTAGEPGRRTTSAHPRRQSAPASRVAPRHESARADGSGWNVLAEQLVEFPRPACRPFLDTDEAGATEPRSYGEMWLDQELRRLRERAIAPSRLTGAATAPAQALLRAPASRRRTGAARAFVFEGHDERELRTALDHVLSPEHRVRSAPVAARSRASAALPRPRGLRRLLPGAATRAVLAGALVGASALASVSKAPLAVLPGSVRDPAGGYVYTVRPGDSLWSIASRLQPTGDPRPLVTQLQSELHGASLQPGQRLVIP